MRIVLGSADFAFRFECGLCQPVNGFKLDDKSVIISSIAMHYCIYSAKGELDELQRGLKSLEFLDVVTANPAMSALFKHSPSILSSEMIEDMFVPEFNPKGSNIRAKEEAVIMFYSELLHEIDGNYSRLCYDTKIHIMLCLLRA